MGRKQKLKKERLIKVPAAARAATRKSTAWLSWLIGSVVVVGLIVIGMVVFVQANKARFIKLSVQSTCEKLQKDLYQKQANFTRDETTRMRKLLQQAETMVKTDQPLAVKVGGNLMFVLKVVEEVLQDGKLKTGELDKMEMIIRESQKIKPIPPKPKNE